MGDDDARSRSTRSSCDGPLPCGGLVVHRCILGGPPELETHYYNSANSRGPEATVARCMPNLWQQVFDAASLAGHDGCDTDCASTGSAPPTPHAATAAGAPLPRRTSSDLPPRPSQQATAVPPPWPAAQQPRPINSGRSDCSEGSGCSSLGSSAWLATLAGDQAIMDATHLWVGRDKPEPAVRGGQRKGSGLGMSHSRSYPARLCAAASLDAAAAAAAARRPFGSGGGLAAMAAAAHQRAGPVDVGVPGRQRQALAQPQLLRHAASAPPACTQNLASMCAAADAGSASGGRSDAPLAAAADAPEGAVRNGAPMAPLQPTVSLDSAASASTGDIGAVHGGESPAESLEGCMRGGRRRSGSMLRSSSLELALLTRSASTRSLFGGPCPYSSALNSTHSLPARYSSTRCLETAGSWHKDLHSAHSMPCALGGAAAASGGGGSRSLERAAAGIRPMAASCSQLELLTSPDDTLLGCSIVRVRLGSLPDQEGGEAAAPCRAPLPPAPGGCAWRPSAALAAAAASAGAVAAGVQLRPGEPLPGKHQGLEELAQRRAELEEALGAGWSSAAPAGLPLVAEEPHDGSPPQQARGGA